MKQYVRRALPAVEKKTNWYHDNEVQLNSLSQGAMQGYPLLANGTAVTARLGNEINLSMFQVKGILYNNSTQESYARMLIVGHAGTIDPNMATFPLFVNGQTGSTATVGSVNGLDTMYFPINKSEIKVYSDKKFKIAGSVSGNGARNTRSFNCMVKWPGKGKKITYKGNTSGVNNQSYFVSVIWIIADANDDTSTGTVMELSSLTRFWFTDC